MLLFVILSVCLFGVLSTQGTCIPNKLQGQLFNLATNAGGTFYSDYSGGRLVTMTSEDDFTYLNITTETTYFSKGGNCTYAATEIVPRCITEKIEPRLEWFGLDNGFPVETYLIPSNNGGPTRYLELTPNGKFPIAFGLVGEGNTINNLVLYLGVRRGVQDMSVFDVDLSHCVAEST